MILAAHAIVGGVVGEAIDQQVVAFVVGFILHFVLDAIPHFDSFEREKFDRKQFVFTLSEFVLGLLFIYFFLHPTISLSSPFLWGMFGSLLPDFIDNMPLWSKQIRRTKFGHYFRYYHQKCHSKIYPRPLIGLLIQFAVICFFLVTFR